MLEVLKVARSFWEQSSSFPRIWKRSDQLLFLCYSSADLKLISASVSHFVYLSSCKKTCVQNSLTTLGIWGSEHIPYPFILHVLLVLVLLVLLLLVLVSLPFPHSLTPSPPPTSPSLLLTSFDKSTQHSSVCRALILVARGRQALKIKCTQSIYEFGLIHFLFLCYSIFI